MVIFRTDRRNRCHQVRRSSDFETSRRSFLANLIALDLAFG